MILGHGDIASALVDRPDRLYMAAGVSNSQCDDEAEYDREIALLEAQDTKNHLVYFSSLALFYGDTRYVRHKYQMEKLIKTWFPRYTIIRIGNITWGSNPHTLINYLKAHPEAEIRDEYRFVVDQDEFLYWIGLIPSFSCEMNIPGRRLKVAQIKAEYV